MSQKHAMLHRPGVAVHAAIRALYEALCYAIPCTECEALAGEPCRPYRLLASRSGCPPTAVATQDPHKPRREVAWGRVYALAQSVSALECPACGGAVDTRFPGSPLHVCDPRPAPDRPTIDDDVTAMLTTQSPTSS